MLFLLLLLLLLFVLIMLLALLLLPLLLVLVVVVVGVVAVVAIALHACAHMPTYKIIAHDMQKACDAKGEDGGIGDETEHGNTYSGQRTLL